MIKILCNVTLTKENKKEIQQMFNAGLTVEQIVNKLGIKILI